MTALLHKGRIVLSVDTLVHEWPDEEDLANIARRAAGVARHLGLEPRVAFVSFSTFGYPRSERACEYSCGVAASFGVNFCQADAGNGLGDGDRADIVGCRSVDPDLLAELFVE